MSEKITERNEINEYIESIILKHRSTVTKEEWDERKQENTQNLFNNSTLSLLHTGILDNKRHWSDDEEGWKRRRGEHNPFLIESP